MLITVEEDVHEKYLRGSIFSILINVLDMKHTYIKPNLYKAQLLDHILKANVAYIPTDISMWEVFVETVTEQIIGRASEPCEMCD